MNGISLRLASRSWAPPARNSYDATFKPTPRLGVLEVGPGMCSESNTPVVTPEPDHMDLVDEKRTPAENPCLLELSRDKTRLRVPQNCEAEDVREFLQEHTDEKQPSTIRGITFLMGRRVCLCPRHLSVDSSLAATCDELLELVPKATSLLVLANDPDTIHQLQVPPVRSISRKTAVASVQLGLSTLSTSIAPRGDVCAGLNLEIVIDTVSGLFEHHTAALLETLKLYAACARPHKLASLRVELPYLPSKRCVKRRCDLAIHAACAAVGQLLDVHESREWCQHTAVVVAQMQGILAAEAGLQTLCLQTLSATLSSASSYMLRHCYATTAFLTLMYFMRRYEMDLKVNDHLDCVVLRLGTFSLAAAEGLDFFLQQWVGQSSGARRTSARLFLQMQSNYEYLEHLRKALPTALRCHLHIVLVGENSEVCGELATSTVLRRAFPSKVHVHVACDPSGRTPVAQLTMYTQVA